MDTQNNTCQFTFTSCYNKEHLSLLRVIIQINTNGAAKYVRKQVWSYLMQTGGQYNKLSLLRLSWWRCSRWGTAATTSSEASCCCHGCVTKVTLWNSQWQLEDIRIGVLGLGKLCSFILSNEVREARIQDSLCNRHRYIRIINKLNNISK